MAAIALRKPPGLGRRVHPFQRTLPPHRTAIRTSPQQRWLPPWSMPTGLPRPGSVEV